MDRKQQSQAKFCVVLHCTKSDKSETKDIYFDSPPLNTLDIKEQIQKQFSIPVCVQVLSFDGYTLKGNSNLSDLRIHNGDTFGVDYLAMGDCSDLEDIISWLRQLTSAIASQSSNLHDVTKIGARQGLIKNLRSCFSPWNDQSYVNILYFVDNGGLKMIIKVYEFLLQKTWNEMDQDFKYLECWIVRSLRSFPQSFPLCRLLIQHNAIPLLTQSLLRVRLEEGKMLQDYDTSGRRYQQSLLAETFRSAIGALFK